MKISSPLGQAVKRKCHFLTYDISFKIDFSIFKIRKVIGDKLGISSLIYGAGGCEAPSVSNFNQFVVVFLALCDVSITEHISTFL